MMEPKIIAMLDKADVPKNIQHLMTDLKKMTSMGRNRMKDHWRRWDINLQVFEGLRYPDEKDIEAMNNDEPTKMVVPTAYTQIMTFVTFCFALFQQNDTFFVLDTFNNDMFKVSELAEDLLERDLKHNRWKTMLFQLLLDVARMGVCCTKTVWAQEKVTMQVEQEAEEPPFQDVGPFGVAVDQGPQTTTVTKEVIKYEGNKIIAVSPYRLITDPRLPLTRWREGRFVADEYSYHKHQLEEMEENGEVAGTKWIHQMTPESAKATNRDFERFEGGMDAYAPQGHKAEENDFMVVTTEGQFKLVPSKYGLGPEKTVVDYVITYANDNRIIKIERCDYAHKEFIYDIAQFLPDVHLKLSQALSDVIAALQDVISWLINARILSVRRGLMTHAVVDPSVINTELIESRNPIIELRKGAPRVGIDRFFMQLQYHDPTVTHFQDADLLTKMIQAITGINENAMGQYAPGRRSAQENRSANQGAASRMVMHASIIWTDLIEPMGRKMLSNQRQAMSFETFTKILGRTPPNPELSIEDAFNIFAPEDVTEIVGNEDFFAFDGTTQVERNYIAQALNELLEIVMNSPLGPQLQYDPNKLIDTALEYRGVRNTARFKTSPPVQGSAPGQVGAGQAQGIAPGAGALPQLPPGATLPPAGGGGVAG